MPRGIAARSPCARSPRAVVARRSGETQRLHQAEVDHRPAKLAFHRYSHNLVLDAVVVGVEGEVKVAVLVVDTEVELRGVLGAQLRVAHERIIEVVQCWCAEDALVERAHGERAAMPRGEEHRREARERGSALPEVRLRLVALSARRGGRHTSSGRRRS